MRNFLLYVFFLLLGTISAQSTTVFAIRDSKVAFTSDAPLELIEAESSAMRGLIDVKKRTFAFSIPVNSFKGFNGPLQRIHFNENYLESDRFGNATFLGKIIESVDLSQDGEYTIRAKGKLTIHGIEQERIIKSLIKVTAGKLTFQSSFTVLLHEHNIEIPRIVYQKIAEEIKVDIVGRMQIKGL